MLDKPLSIEEEAALYAKWDRGTFPTVEESVSYHHLKHGGGMNLREYLRNAAAFNRAGARRTLSRDAEKFSTEKDEFLIEKQGKIVSYGPPRD